MTSETVFDRDKRIRNAALTMPQTFYLVTLNQFIGRNANAWPSQDTLAATMNATKRAVQKWQAELEAMGVLEVESGRGCRVSNQYRLNLDKLTPKVEPCSEPNSELCSSFSEPNSELCSSGIANTVRLNSEHSSYQLPMNNHVKEQRDWIPENLNTVQFLEAWSQWVEYRREIKKSLSPSTVKKQLAMLAGWGTEKAVRSIDASIGNGWQGLFDPDQKPGRGGSVAADKAWHTLKSALRQVDKSRPYKDELRKAIGDQVFQAAEAVGFRSLFDISEFNESKLFSTFAGALAQVTTVSGVAG